MNTLIYAFVTSGAKTVLGLLLVVLLTSGIWMQAFLRSVVFFPVLVSTIGVGITFAALMHPMLEVINLGFGYVGIDGPARLSDPALALYPHLTVRENIGFGLSLAKVPKEQIRDRVAAAAEALQLTPLLDRKPKALSGGQRQRVAIGRAIVRDPQVFLFGEPLSNLDAALRAQMRIELSDLHRKLGATMIYVTHDQVEAMTMADKIVVLNGGQIEQVGSPMDLYNAPVSPFVAGFIGSPKMNLYDGRAAGESCGTYGIRPEHLRLTADLPRWTGTVRHVERLGADTFVYLIVAGLGEMVVRADGDQFPKVGSTCGVSPVPGREFRFA